MDIIIFPQHWSALLCICIMIVTLILAYYKKWMMTYALIIANFAVFIVTILYSFEVIYGLGFRPIYLTPEYFPQIYTLFTSMFIHSVINPWHIMGNMLIFFFIGTAFEQRIGWKKFIIIYFVTGMCAAIAHSIININTENSTTVLIGASGAIFGIMGAFAYSYPRDEVIMPIPIGIMFLTRIKVMYAVILFAALETIIVALAIEDMTAHFAHIGGLISGFILAAILLRKKKTHTKEGATIYYDSFADQRLSNIDIKELKKLATTPELKDMYKKIEKETVPQVRDVWLEHFIENAVCPKCGKSLHHFDNKIWCEYCGFRTNY